MMSDGDSVAIVANGIIQDDDQVAPLLRAHQRVIAADGGLIHCDRMGIEPDLLVGDFDSTPPELLKKYQHLPIERYPTDKDFTDLELAIQAAQPERCSRITLFAAWGDRLDCTLANLYILGRYPGLLRMENEKEIAYVITGERQISCQPNQRISLLPLPGISPVVRSRGLKWELEGQRVDQQFFSISNRTLHDHFTLEVSEGTLLIILRKL